MQGASLAGSGPQRQVSASLAIAYIRNARFGVLVLTFLMYGSLPCELLLILMAISASSGL